MTTTRRPAYTFLFLLVAGVRPVGPCHAAELRVDPATPHGLEVARALARTGRRMGPVDLVLEAGTYRLDRPLELTVSDSGTERHPAVWRAAVGATVRLTGAVRVTGWETVREAAILARLDAAARPAVRVTDLRSLGLSACGPMVRRGFGLPVVPGWPELVCGDRIMPLARHPNTGWLNVTATLTGRPVERFAFRDATVRTWNAQPDLWLHGYWAFDWADTWDPAVAFDGAHGEAAIGSPQGWYGVLPEARFTIVNALEALDEPGEWWLDRSAGRLYFWPPADAALETTELTWLDGPLVSIKGAHDLRLEGLTLENGRGTGVRITGGTACTVSGCTVRNLGTVGVDVEGGLRHTVTGCSIYETGDDAIRLGGGDRRTLAPSGHRADGNDLHDFSRLDRVYHPGIAVTGVGVRVTHNRIHDAPHNAILLGGNDHLIEANDISRVCRETGDAGAFYMGRNPTDRGTVIRGNLFHDLTERIASTADRWSHVMAVYLDDCACGTRIEGNTFVRAGWAVMIGGGRDHTVINNVFVDCTPAIHVDARGLTWGKPHFEGDWEIKQRFAEVPWESPRWTRRYPELARYWREDPTRPRGNRIEGNTCLGGTWKDLADGLTDATAGIGANFIGTP